MWKGGRASIVHCGSAHRTRKRGLGSWESSWRFARRRAGPTPARWWSSSSRCSRSGRSATVFDVEITDGRDGFIAFRATGDRAEDVFRHEAGGHRWQRVPPNDKRGRVHTSTVTVAVLPEPTATQLTIGPGDLSWAFSRGSGPGGQNRNKTETAVDLTHRPTGVVVHCESERSQGQNKVNALAMLRARLWSAQVEAAHAEGVAARRQQLGSGARGDKTWTVRTQDDVVTHHATGQRFRLREYLDGDYEVGR